MLRRKTKAQTVAEYAVLFSLVIAAAVAMQLYVKRGLQARMKSGTDAFTSISGNIADATGGAFTSAQIGNQGQYEPYYAESSYDRYQESVEQEHMENGAIVKEKVADVSATAAGGFERMGASGAHQNARDAAWE